MGYHRANLARHGALPPIGGDAEETPYETESQAAYRRISQRQLQRRPPSPLAEQVVNSVPPPRIRSADRPRTVEAERVDALESVGVIKSLPIASNLLSAD